MPCFVPNLSPRRNSMQCPSSSFPMKVFRNFLYIKNVGGPSLKFKNKILMVGIKFSFRMIVTWREREHTTIDNEVMNDQQGLDALRGCGLLEIFKMPKMKANTRLLEMLIHYWSIEDDAFMIDKMPLRIEI